VEVGTG